MGKEGGNEVMLTDEQRQLIRRLRAGGMTYDHIGELVGCSGNAARNIALDVVCPSSKDTYAEGSECRKIFRRIKRQLRRYKAAMQTGTMKPCEHCRWRKNKEPVPVCVVCYRESFAVARARKG